jgi:hypothetical protein
MVNNSVLFFYPWKEGEKKLKFLIRVEKSDMAGLKKNYTKNANKID